MYMYNLTECSDNYSDTSGSLWQFKRGAANNNANVTVDNSSPFKYKSNLIDTVAADETVKKLKIVVLLQYLSNFWR